MSIDFGEKRIGLAISDPDGRVAIPFQTITRRSDEQAAAAIAAIAAQEGIERLVVGLPRTLEGGEGAAARRARSFSRRLAGATGLVPILVDEALTSVEAEERLRSRGLSPKRRKELVDAVAAQILLEEALARQEGA